MVSGAMWRDIWRYSAIFAGVWPFARRALWSDVFAVFDGIQLRARGNWHDTKFEVSWLCAQTLTLEQFVAKPGDIYFGAWTICDTRFDTFCDTRGVAAS